MPDEYPYRYTFLHIPQTTRAVARARSQIKRIRMKLHALRVVKTFSRMQSITSRADGNLHQRHPGARHIFAEQTIGQSTITELFCLYCLSQSRCPLGSTGRPTRDFDALYMQRCCSSCPWTRGVRSRRLKKRVSVAAELPIHSTGQTKEHRPVHYDR